VTEENSGTPTDVENTSGGAGKSVRITLGIIIGLVLLCILVACVVIAILLLLGPTVGNIFFDVVENLEMTPTPSVC
jgi:hypothetical protein